MQTRLIAAEGFLADANPFWLYSGFLVMVFVAIGLDLFVVHRKKEVMSIRSAVGWTLVWMSLALIFNVIVYFLYEARVCGVGLNVPQLSGAPRDVGGWEAAKLFFTGYLIEQSLSADNVMVIAVILSSMKIPPGNQRRVLYWGIVGALVLRGLMIFAGVELIRRFDWVLYIFGGMLLLGALKLLFSKEDENADPRNGWTARIVGRFVPLSPDLEGERFFTRKNGILMATPLFLALVIVEVTDLIFAVDSIPAVFSITLDPFLIFTSNVCAILGLRSLYFCVAALMRAFVYLKYSLIAVLLFVAAKMLLRLHMNETISLGIIIGLLALGVGASLLWGKTPAHKPTDPPTV